MGIMVPVARTILREHKRKPITGQGLLIGRQTIPLTIDEARAMVREEGIALRDTIPRLDATTFAGKGRDFIEDISFFELFSDITFRTLDVTDYEGAEIIHDMHVPVPDSLENNFDFIWNGSCLDNMFDPAMAMRSTGRMLRPGGRVICMEMGTPHYDAYTMYSQAWFFDYFAINNYKYCKIYSCVFGAKDVWDGPYDLYVPDNYRDASRLFPMKTFPKKALITLAIAEKGSESTWEKMPVQWQYRPDHTVYREAFDRFIVDELMPLHARGRKTVPERPGFKFVGELEAIPGRRFPNERSPIGPRLLKALADPGWAVTRLVQKLRYG